MSAFYYNLIAQGVPPHMAAAASGYRPTSAGSRMPFVATSPSKPTYQSGGYSNGQIGAPYISTAKPANTWTQGDGYYPGKVGAGVGVAAGTPTSRAYSLAHPWPSGVTPSYNQGAGAPGAKTSGSKKTSSPTASGTKATPRTGTSAPAAAAGPVQAAHLTTQVMDAPPAAAPAAPTLSPQQQAANDYLTNILGAAQQTGPIPGATPQFVGYPTMFASLSPTQLASPEVQATIAALLAEAGAPAPTGGTLPAGAVSSAMMYNPDGTFNWDLYHQALAQGLKVQ